MVIGNNFASNHLRHLGLLLGTNDIISSRPPPKLCAVAHVEKLERTFKRKLSRIWKSGLSNGAAGAKFKRRWLN
jgi:hypothetical protein